MIRKEKGIFIDYRTIYCNSERPENLKSLNK